MLSRMVLRGDVKEAEVLNRRTLSLAQLESGKLPFQQGTTQNGDLKSFSGEPHHSIMAVGRAVVDFADSPEPMAKFDPAKHREGSTLVSTTKQLCWTVDDKHTGRLDQHRYARHAGRRRLCTRSGTAVCGSLPHAADPLCGGARHGRPSGQRKLADDNSILIVAVARAQNTGMAIRGNLVIRKGDGPVRESRCGQTQPEAARYTHRVRARPRWSAHGEDPCRAR